MGEAPPVMDEARMWVRAGRRGPARLGHNHSKVFGRERLRRNASEAVQRAAPLRGIQMRTCKIRPKKAVAVRAKRRSACREGYFCVFLLKKNANSAFHACAPAANEVLSPRSRTPEFTSRYQFKKKRARRNFAKPLTIVKISHEKKRLERRLKRPSLKAWQGLEGERGRAEGISRSAGAARPQASRRCAVRP